MLRPVRGTEFYRTLYRQALRSVGALSQTKTQTPMSYSERFSFTEPALCHYNYDMSKSWFVYFTITDKTTRKKYRFQFRKNLNEEKTKQSRLKLGKAMTEGYAVLLKDGWNPILKDDIKKMPNLYSVSEAFTRMLAIRLPDLRDRTKESYTYIVKRFTTWLQEKSYSQIPLKEFSKNLGKEYFDYLTIEWGYSPRTHNDHLIVLKTLINEMKEREWLFKSPFKDIKRKPTSTGRNKAFSDSEKEILKNVLYEKDRDMYYFSQIIYYCFIRRSELARLKICNFDLVNNTIIIPADVSKNKIQESVVIPVGLDSVLKEMELHKYDSNDYIFGYRLKRSSRLYKNFNHISARHNKFPKRLGFDLEKGLYSWKHTGTCVAYYATGKDIYSVMRQLRHKDLSTTQIYLKSLGLVQNDIFRSAMVA